MANAPYVGQWKKGQIVYNSNPTANGYVGWICTKGGNTYDGTLLSTDTKYIAFENTLDNISFTEEQYKTAMDELLTKGEVNLTGVNNGENGENGDSGEEEVSTIEISLSVSRVYSSINVYKNNGVNPIFSVENEKNASVSETFTVEVLHGDVLKFIGINPNGISKGDRKGDKLKLEEDDDTYIEVIEDNITFDEEEVILSAKIDFYNEDMNRLDEPVGNIGRLECYIEKSRDII